MDVNLQLASNANDCSAKLPLEIQPGTPKKKHDMVLSLGKVVSSTDQTPTPIRFMRTCEEMGLFQDLTNVNPFEETFRKAVEAGKTGELPKMSLLNAPANDDTLNTPHIFPVPMENKISIPPPPVHPPPEIEKVVRTEADTSVQITTPSIPDHSLSPVDLCAPKSPPPPKQDDDLAVLLRMADGRVVQLSTKPVSLPPPEVYPSRIEPLTNERRPASKTVIIATQHMYPLETITPPALPPTSTTSNVKEKLKQALLGSNKEKGLKFKSSQNTIRKTDSPSKRPSESENSESDSERKKRILERNRLAAMKCREKKKKWIEDLGRKANLAFASNHALNQEVNALRAEVAHLKSLLLLHKDCPVTIAQNQGNNKPAESGTKRIQARERLSLNIEEAKKHIVIDLDSPLIRSDHVLTSVAPKTPTDQIPEVVLDDERPSTVIQLNPNALRPPLSEDLYS